MRRGLILGRMHMQRHPLPTSQLKPDYPVLAPLSRSYPKSKGRLPTRYSPVRHSTQGRSPFLVRLACVRHAASVHSEPESNSPVTYNCQATMLLYKTLIQVLFAPTRYLFVKDPCPFRQEEIVSIDSLTHRQALSSFFLGELILWLVSRLDAFSGYPFRT
jgi:hypothetical protein